MTLLNKKLFMVLVKGSKANFIQEHGNRGRDH